MFACLKIMIGEKIGYDVFMPSDGVIQFSLYFCLFQIMLWKKDRLRYVYVKWLINTVFHTLGNVT